MKIKVSIVNCIMGCFLLTSHLTYGAAEQAEKVTSSQQAAKIVKNKYGGKVLKVNKQKNDNYKVKLVKPNGQVISKKVNAETGKIERKE